MSIKYIGGGVTAAAQHTSEDSEFVVCLHPLHLLHLLWFTLQNVVRDYDLRRSVCFVMIADLPGGSMASSWGTLDVTEEETLTPTGSYRETV